MGPSNKRKEIKCYDENFNLLGIFGDVFADVLDVKKELPEVTLEPKTMLVPWPTKIIKQGPATVIFWRDGTKTVVKRAEGEPDDDYAAFTAAVAKKVYGSGSKVKSFIRNTETVKR